MNRTFADIMYKTILDAILQTGTEIETRNSVTYRHFNILPITFVSTPLITWRKTAWKKALKEMEWFLSGEPTCPEELLDWWDDQLNPEGKYIGGYGNQLKSFGRLEGHGYDQIQFIIDELQAHPNSRRLLTTTWNPREMSRITNLNDNIKTPTTCHGTFSQYFTEKGALYIKTYQRSADMLLGVPHNWIQYWAFLLWLAKQTDLKVGGIIWLFGDAHIYKEESHEEVARSICNSGKTKIYAVDLVYTGKKGDEFRAEDFVIIGNISEPETKIRPKLL